VGELRLTLLGRPEVVCGGMPLTGWSLQKSLALLSYLAVTDRPHGREALAGLFWPDHPEANARSNLRKGPGRASPADTRPPGDCARRSGL